MATEVFMPQLGMTMTEGSIVRWLKREGEQVVKGEILLEVLTDKATVEVEASASGVLSGVRAAEGEIVPVGSVVALILAPDERLVPSSPESARAKESEGAVTLPNPGSDSGSSSPFWFYGAGVPPSMLPAPSTGPALKISPRARRLAQHQDIQIETLKGTGPIGRIVEADVRLASADASRVLTPTPAAQRVATDVLADPSGIRGTGSGLKANVEQVADLRPILGIRKLVADRMTKSSASVPHFHLSVEADAAMLVGMRVRLAPPIEAQSHAHLTFTDILVLILAQALKRHTEVNVAWAEGAIRRLPHIGIGVATATPEGLVVPVVHDAERLSLAEVAQQTQLLAEKARTGNLTLTDLEGATCTLTNLGMFNIDSFDPIVNMPQAAILAVGRIKERPFVVGGQLAVRPTIRLTLAIDHRVLDGAEAANFLDFVVDLIEKPYLLADRLFI